jgi:hypothetical protein
MITDLNQRIVIIGAGPAGLAAAEFLREKGYKKIILLEKESQAGGKCHTIWYKKRSYEMGAGVIVANNHLIRSLAEKYQIKLKRIDFSRPILFWDSVKLSKISEPSWWDKARFAREIFGQYRRFSKKYSKITEPGLLNVDKDLCQPFSVWAEKHNIPLTLKSFGPFFTGFGYGYFDEIPAAYVLKYYSWEMLKSFIRKQVYDFPEGIQSLWLKMADNYDVYFSTMVKSVKRGKNILIKTNQGDFECDKLIVAGGFDNVSEYLDVDPEETELIGSLKYYDYRTYACVVDGIEKCDGYIPGNFVPSRAGQPIFWYHRYADSDLYTFYVLADFKMSDQEIIKNINTLVSELGGQLKGVEKSMKWKYFPHVDERILADGYFDKFEARQGVRNTYFVGESLNFATVELSAEQARDIVQRYF